MEHNPAEYFFDRLMALTTSKELIRLVISNRKDRSSDLNSIIVTLTELKKGLRLNFVYRHATKDITKNHDFAEGFALIRQALQHDFFSADLFAGSENIRWVCNPAGKIKVTTAEPTLQPVTQFSHDRIKPRAIQTAGNIYLRELGITNAQEEVRREMSDKYRQINRYIELLAPELREITLPPDYHVIDMGSGKGYLTFALYDYLTGTLKGTPVMTGVEFREELVAECSRIASLARFDRLRFVSGTIEKADLARIDILIALHACDTATDEALFRGIRSGSSLIVVAPCCHKQIRKAMSVTNQLSPLVKYGIMKERQAEIVTDTIRALILEANGYKTKVFEFISTEHTPKNVMIIGRKTNDSGAHKEKIYKEIAAIREAFGIDEHYLEGLLKRT